MNVDVEEVYTRICRLFGECLRPYGELVDISLTPEIEKDLLISLSQVYRQIKQWTLELDSDLDNVSAEECKKDACGSCVASGSHPHEHQCMANIVVHLVSLIGLQKPLVQHLTESILVAISEFVSTSGPVWEEYIQLLCRWLKLAHQTLSYSVARVVFEGKVSDFDSLISVWPLKLKSENGNYVVISSILCVLHKVLKLLKLNMNDKLLEAYLKSITDTFSNMQWDLFHEVYVVSNCEAPAGSAGHNSLQQHAIQSKSITIFHANLIQLCCSLIDVNGVTEARSSTDVPCITRQIRNLIPKIVAVCISKPENRDDCRMFHYLRHKILMLLMRLGFKVHLEYSDLISWLHIIEKYFQDLLLKPLKRVNESNEECLEGSPFWEDGFEAERCRISSHHLQRLVVFLLLRCSLTLEKSKGKSDEQFSLVSSVSHTAVDLHLQSECSSRSEGVSVFQKWLLRHLPTSIFVDHEMYPQRCTDFALLFLKLYMHEDDILFEMLLQLLSVPCYCTWIDYGETLSTTTMNAFLCLISDIFNPIHLFHLFLEEIHYDHQVLLDYLISKDTGAKSAEYLLRCLRMVCNSWKLFVELPEVEKSPNPSCQKRRKVLTNFMELQEGFNTTLVEDDLNSSTLGTDSQKGYLFDGKNERVQKFSFEDAEGCLLSLKTSISSLYQKNLFPYNPQVLLRRLSRFQELCLKEMEEEKKLRCSGYG